MPNEAVRVRELSYSAPLISNIRQILTGLQGFDSMAREIIQNADDAGARSIRFDITDEALVVWNDAAFLSCGLNSDECPWTTSGSPQLGKRKACDFHAISKVGSGNKYNQPGLIGRFGIGFVSVYQLTDQPVIRSQGTIRSWPPYPSRRLWRWNNPRNQEDRRHDPTQDRVQGLGEEIDNLQCDHHGIVGGLIPWRKLIQTIEGTTGRTSLPPKSSSTKPAPP